MENLALGLVLTSAGLHAVWNFLAKRASGESTFVWLFSALSTLIYLPLAIIIFIVQRPHIGLPEVGAIAITGLLHVAYYMLLNRGYRVGDLSLVYPIARGAGPMLSVVAAVIFLGERPSLLAVGGMLLIVLSVVVVTGNPRSARRDGVVAAIVYGLLVAVSIAVYTLWDKQVVSVYLIPPLILTWTSGAMRTVVLAPHALRHWPQVRQDWQRYRQEALGIAVLDPLSYILFLIALSFSQVSHLAPLRQTSILIGAFLGARLLAEKVGRRRVVAAVVMLIGVIALTLG